MTLDALESLDPAVAGIMAVAIGLAVALALAVIAQDRLQRRVRLTR